MSSTGVHSADWAHRWTRRAHAGWLSWFQDPSEQRQGSRKHPEAAQRIPPQQSRAEGLGLSLKACLGGVGQ